MASMPIVKASLGSLSGIFVILFPMSAISDPLPLPWQAKREDAIHVTDAACAGDEEAISEVHIRLAKDDPATMNAIHWLRDNCDHFAHIPVEAASEYQRKAAIAGFPIAMYNYALGRLHGLNEITVDDARGLELMKSAAQAGYGVAAAYLYETYSRGKMVRRDPEQARRYLEKAIRENVSEDEMKSVRDLIDRHDKRSLASSQKTQSQTASRQPEKPAGVQDKRTSAGKGISRKIEAEIRSFSHEVDAHAIAYSPDGRHLLVGGADSTARLIDARDGSMLRRFKGAGQDMFTEGAVIAVAFSNDGQHVLTSDPDNIIRMWAVDSGREIRKFQGHERQATSLKVSPGGESLLSGSYDGSVRLWDLSSGREVRRYVHHDGSGPDQYIHSVEFSQDARLVLAGSGDALARIWDTETGQELQSLPGSEDAVGYTSIAAFTADGRNVVYSNKDAVRIIDTQSGTVLREIDTMDPVVSLDVSPDGEMVIFGGDRGAGSIHIFDIEGILHERPDRLNGYPSNRGAPEVAALSFSPDGREAVSIRNGQTIKFWGPEPD